MINNQAIYQEYMNTYRELLQLLSAFSQEQLNTPPAAGSWTAAQVGRHLQKGTIADAIEAPGAPTLRAPDEKEAAIKSVFLDFNTKLQSPDFVIPEPGEYNKQQLLQEMEAMVHRTGKAIQAQDLSMTYTGFDFPQMGQLTKQEWVCFAVSHAKRHIRQVKRIYEAVVRN
jgi:uncharacterized damage-inducible protein DinB